MTKMPSDLFIPKDSLMPKRSTTFRREGCPTTNGIDIVLFVAFESSKSKKRLERRNRKTLLGSPIAEQ
jgi:hypothetical protein